MHVMKIRITGLTPGHNEIEEVIEPSLVGLDGNTFRSLVNVHIQAEKGTGKISLSLETDGLGSFICDRCGDDFQRETQGECELVFIQRDEPFPDEAPGDDLRSYGPYQEYIDVSTDVHDAFMLSLSMKNLCDDDCKGLCSKCGVNLNHSECRCTA